MSSPRTRARASLAEQALMAVLGRMRTGQLRFVDSAGAAHEFGGLAPGPEAEVSVRDAAAARTVLAGASIGLAEAYIDGGWDTPDLEAVLALGLANMRSAGYERLPKPLRPVQRAWHRLRNNTRRGSRRNIAHHYDLGNDFYELWLDETMTYSSAMFEGPDSELPEPLDGAQRRKWDRLLELLQPDRKDHLLEIGCGWGGFAMHAAREAGCRVTGVTLSREQHDWAVRRIAEEGLDGRVSVRLQDYRDIPGTYSGIASVEMFEAVGERHWPVFFRRVQELLDAGGRAAIQTITICEEQLDHYRSNPDFIQRYIFPGGMLPSPSRFKELAEEAQLRIAGEPAFFGQSYAQTLERWQERFDGAREQVRALGFDERFLRMWRYYLTYCRVGFRSGNIDVMQVGLDR